MANPSFDESFDVVVAGFGFGGAVAAINAADAGARVLLAEKEAAPGGISICSYGAIRSAHNADEAFAYLKATNGGRIADDLLRHLAEGMVRVESEVRELAATCNAELELRENGGNYPFPGAGTFYDTNIVNVPGSESAETLYPNLIGSGHANGWRVFKMLQENIAKRAITVRCGFPAKRLIAGTDREVLGVRFNDGTREVAIEAKRAVVLACGGFESDPDMKQQYWEKTPVLAAATTSNTGDGIRMAQDLGAQLWHMWHFHGSYGFKHPNPRYADSVGIRAKRLPDWVPGEEQNFRVQMAWIIVDQDGSRYMNECTPYTQDTSHRPMEFYDSQRQTFPRIPSFLVYDENGRKLYPIGSPTFNNADLAYDWSRDNLREVDLGIIKKAGTVAGLARLLGCDAGTLEASFARWNALCAARNDADFGRPPGSMMPLDTPPYYAGAVWPVVSNTQGGPVHDTRQRILGAFGEPIPRLFVAGELGSIFGHLYLSGGNLTECFVGGRIAGREAAGSAPRK